MRRSMIVLIATISLLIPVLAHAQRLYYEESRDFWFRLSVDAGTPYIGMCVDPANKFANSSAQIYPGSVLWADGIANLTLGYTPWHVSPRTRFGFLVRGSYAVTYGNGGTTGYDLTYNGYFLGNDNVSVYYLGQWFAVSPMATARFRIGPRGYVDLAVGASYWSYISMTGNVYDSDGYINTSATSNLGGLASVSGIALSALVDISFGWNTFEAGLLGPDVFVGWGVTL